MGWLTSIFSFFSSGSSLLTLIPLACSLAFGGLWLYERHTSQELAALNGQLTAANSGQAAAIEEFKAKWKISEQILLKREDEIEDIRTKAVEDKARIASERKTDTDLDNWLSADLPDPIVKLLAHPDDQSGADNQADATGSVAAGSSGTGPAR